MTAKTVRRLLALIAPAAIATLAGGCVYYNGIYNAKDAAKAGDARLRRGDESGASEQFQLSAQRAETVLVGHPDSKWRARALYLAGRGAAWGNECGVATNRLDQFLAIEGTDQADRNRARLALAACDTRASRLPVARARLDSLLEVSDKETTRQARIWAARAALAAGDRDAVGRYLQGMEISALQWELVQVSLAAGEYARAESLLVERASRGDYRDDATRAIRELWGRGRVGRSGAYSCRLRHCSSGRCESRLDALPAWRLEFTRGARFDRRAASVCGENVSGARHDNGA